MISFEDARRIYIQSSIQNEQSVLNLNATEAKTAPFDYAAAKQEALKGNDWYINMVRATASLVSKGASDKKIESEMVSWTIPPYSENETLNDVRIAVAGARSKNFDKKEDTKNQFEIEVTENDPLPLIREFPPSQSYPTKGLGPLKNIVQAVQKKTQAPIEIAAASALSTASLILQGHANVETLAGERPVSLYMLTIARSGERKSSCDGEFIFGIKQFEKELSKCNEADFLKFKNRSDIYQAERNSLLTQIRSKNRKISRKEAEKKLELLGPEPTAPPSTDIIVSEPTFEGLTQMYKNGQPALGLFSDEGGQFLGGHAMNAENKQKTLAAFNDLWGGNSIRRTRQGDGAYQLHDRRLAIHLMVQPTVAHELLSDPLAIDTGFLARFLICEPQSTIGTRIFKNSIFDRGSIAEFQNYQMRLLEEPKSIHPETGGLEVKSLRLSNEAKAQLIEFSDEVERQQLKGKDYEAITGTASKSAEQAARIAGVLTLWQNLGALNIGPFEMEQAITLARYYLDEAKRLVEVSIASRELQEADNLLKWISKNYGTDAFVFSNILQFGPNGIRDSKQLKKLFKILEEFGWLKKMPNRTIVEGKPRNTAFRLAELAEA